VLLGDIISDTDLQARAGTEQYDLVLANILADIIIPLQKVVWAQMKIGAKMNLSGIINIRADEVREALLANPHYRLIDTEILGEWVSFTVERVS
jgi:ribosomal protein L11 methyltransferase